MMTLHNHIDDSDFLSGVDYWGNAPPPPDSVSNWGQAPPPPDSDSGSFSKI